MAAAQPDETDVCPFLSRMAQADMLLRRRWKSTTPMLRAGVKIEAERAEQEGKLGTLVSLIAQSLENGLG